MAVTRAEAAVGSGCDELLSSETKLRSYSNLFTNGPKIWMIFLVDLSRSIGARIVLTQEMNNEEGQVL